MASGRAFASLPLPSHLAVLLATALPLLLVRVRATPRGLIWVAAAVVTILGLVATRSPVGLGLAVLAVAPILVGRHRAAMLLVVGSLVVAIAAVVVVRPDVAKLEPVSLRLDNWRTGVWLWTTSPASGVGVASFAQASQANPLAVGNRPAHAHSVAFEALAELGPAGLVGVVLLGLWLLRLTTDVWKSNPALALAIAVVPLHNLLDFSLFVSGVALPWAVLLGWAVALSKPPERQPNGGAGSGPYRAGRGGFGGVGGDDPPVDKRGGGGGRRRLDGPPRAIRRRGAGAENGAVAGATPVPHRLRRHQQS